MDGEGAVVRVRGSGIRVQGFWIRVSGCLFGAALGVLLTASTAAAEQAVAAQTLDAERAIAQQEIATGRAIAAIERLERLAPPASSAAAVTLAIAYDVAGFRTKFVALAHQVVAAQASATDLRNRLRIAETSVADSAAGAIAAQIEHNPDTVNALVAQAWATYGARDFARAAAGFKLAADSTPSPTERWETRLMQGQALLEVGTPGSSLAAAQVYAAVADSIRALNAAIDGRVAAGTPAALGRSLAQRRALGLLWAGDADGSRLVYADRARGTLRPMKRAVAREGLAPAVPATEHVAPALAWTPGGAAAPRLRALIDSLTEADARLAAATQRAAGLRAGRAERIAGAARYVTVVRRFADTLAAAERGLTQLGAEVTRRNAGIDSTISAYRAMVLQKIADARAVAEENRRSADSLATATRGQGEVATRMIEAEQGAAREYVAVADAAAQALEAGLTRLEVVVARDTVRAKYRALGATLVQARANYDSSLAAAVAAERSMTAEADREIATADSLVTADRGPVTGLVARAEAAAGELLVSRVPALKGALERLGMLAVSAQANALFHAAIEADTLRAPAADVASRRNEALARLENALGAPRQVVSDNDPAAAVRSSLILKHAELLTRKADADFAASQRGSNPMERPDYVAAIARYDEHLRLFPNDPRADVAAYTMGTIAFASQRYEDAERGFGIVTGREHSPYRPEAFFRNGDAQFERAAKLAGESRRAGFSGAAGAYAKAIEIAPAQGDIYFLALYKLGWSNYMQAERQSSDEYRRAVEIFARLVREVDALPAERQARLALRQEAIDYLAIAITQLGGAEDAVRFLGNIPDVGTRVLVLRRVAHALRDQGEFNKAIVAFRGALSTAPTHPNILETRVELVELFQSRMLEPVRAQEARLELIDSLAPASAWANANAARAAEARREREKALREAGSFELTLARRPRGRDATAYGRAAALFARYVGEFSQADSAQRVSALEGDARFGAREWFASGNAYSRTATRWNADSAVTAAARRNALIAYDSALVSQRRTAASDTAALRAIEDSLFSATERFVAAGGAQSDDSRQALVVMGRRASEASRWEVVAATFTRIAEGWPNDNFAAEARKFVGDARYKQGRYADAQAEWKRAHAAAMAKGRRAFGDSVVNVRVAAAAQRADSLARQGSFVAAADSLLTSMALDIADPIRSPDLLRNAIEVYLDADSAARARGDRPAATSHQRQAISSIEFLAARYPAYQHTLAYSALRARLLSDLGKPAESGAALVQLADANPRWPGRADALLRAAFLQDSTGKPLEAAAAYERFAAAYPADPRAADAQFNAAVILRDGKEYRRSADAFMAFVNRHPGEKRIGDAFAARIAMLRASGDTSTIGPELARLCVRPAAQLTALGASVVATCADRQGAREFAAGMLMWERYAPLRLEIRTAAQLSQAGVAAASAEKQRVLRLMNGSFTRAIATGASDWVAAGSFQSGLAQWYYGLFVRDVVLPAEISEAARQGATTGSNQQAQQYFDAAIKAWTALVDKATTDKFDNAWVEKAKAALRGEGIPARERTP